VTQQAIQLGFIPRLHITHTSEHAAGQIYIPIINWALMIAVILLVLTVQDVVHCLPQHRPRQNLAVTGRRKLCSSTCVLIASPCVQPVEVDPPGGWARMLAVFSPHARDFVAPVYIFMCVAQLFYVVV
jgi:hypothetical protein